MWKNIRFSNINEKTKANLINLSGLILCLLALLGSISTSYHTLQDGGECTKWKIVYLRELYYKFDQLIN